MPSRRRWWGYLACAWALLFAALHFYWALGGDAGLASAAGAELAADAAPVVRPGGLWGVGLLLVAGASLAVMLTFHQGPGRLRRLVTAAGWTVSLLLFLRGAGLEVLLLGGFSESNTALTSSQLYWSLVLWNPRFILGGVAFALATLAARGRGKLTQV